MLQKKFEAIEFHDDLFDKNFEILKHLELKKIEDFTLALSEIKLLLRHLTK